MKDREKVGLQIWESEYRVMVRTTGVNTFTKGEREKKDENKHFWGNTHIQEEDEKGGAIF